MRSGYMHCQRTKEGAAPSGVTSGTKVSLGIFQASVSVLDLEGDRNLLCLFSPPVPLSGPHITAITEKKESLFISWTHIPFLEQRGCILHYRIYWKERDSTAQPELCGMCEILVQQGLLLRCWESTRWGMSSLHTVGALSKKRKTPKYTCAKLLSTHYMLSKLLKTEK